jgi:hypothetical protein
MKYPLMLLMMVTTLSVTKAQDDLPGYDGEKIQSVPGLYLSFNDFIYNSPIDFDKVETDLEKFINDIKYNKDITIFDGNPSRQIKRDDVWGYSDGNDVYLNRTLFSRNLKLGANSVGMQASPWVKIVTIETLSLIGFASAIKTSIYSTTALFSFILNTKDGQFYDADVKVLKELIADDPQLLAELNNDRDSKQTRFHRFLNKYNERHPFQFR